MKKRGLAVDYITKCLLLRDFFTFFFTCDRAVYMNEFVQKSGGEKKRSKSWPRAIRASQFCYPSFPGSLHNDGACCTLRLHTTRAGHRECILKLLPKNYFISDHGLA